MSKRIRIVGLALVVCAFAAISASAAQADTAHWTIEGNTLSNLTPAEETVNVSDTTEAFSLEGGGLTISCTGLASTGAKIKGTNEGSATALNFSGCTVSSAPAACQVKSSGGTVGTISTVAVTLTAKVVTPGVYAVFTPTSGTTFTTLVVEKQTGKSCPVSGTYAVTGNAGGQGVISNSAAEEAVKQSLTFTEASATAAGTQLKLGASNAKFKGKADLVLSGARAGQKWGIEVTNP